MKPVKLIVIFALMAFAQISMAQVVKTYSLGIFPPYYNDIGDNFGNSVAIDGDYAVIGVPGFHNNTGCAYVCEFMFDHWEVIARLTASDKREGNMFGLKADISGDLIVITSSSSDGIYFFTGAAYVFEKPDSGWIDATEDAKLYASDCDRFDKFGHSLGVSDSTIAIGAYAFNGEEGAVYLFEKTEEGWKDTTQTAKLTATDKKEFNHFGISVDIKDSLIVVGSSGDDDNGQNSGSAYIFMRPKFGWTDTTEIAKLLPFNGAADQDFGESVSCDNHTIAVGATYANTNKGAVYIYNKPLTGWVDTTESAVLTASNGNLYDKFGANICIDEQFVLVGAPGFNVLSNDEGIGYLFFKPLSGWDNMTESRIIYNRHPLSGEKFGSSVSFSNEKFIIGTPQRNNSDFIGGAYFYYLTPCDTTYSEEYKSICEGQSYRGWDTTGIYTRQLTRENGCDSIATTYLTVIREPELICPDDIVVQCSDSIPDPYSLFTEFQAAGGDVITDGGIAYASFNLADETSDNETCPETISRIYEISDGCGNTVSCTQLIIVNDTIAPVAAPLDSVYVFCESEIPEPDITIVEATDNCGDVTKTFVGDDSDGHSCPEQITRTYELADACGNTTLIEQIIIVNDTIPPFADTPDPITVNCIGEIPAPDASQLTGISDNCTASPTVRWLEDVSNNQDCPETILRHYEITDDCGNKLDITQTIIIHDEIPPTASNPAPIYLECNEAVPAPNLQVVTDEADNCTVRPIVWYIGDEVTQEECPKIITRTYEVIDNCSNSISVEQQIIFEDNTPPTANPLSSLGPFSCTEIPEPDITQVTGEADDCGGSVTVEFAGDTPAPECSGSITRSYRLTDECGNSRTITQTIFIYDNTPPVSDTLPDLGPYKCINQVPQPDITQVTGATDNCSEIVTVAFLNDSYNPGCSGTMTRTYSLFDQCGNFSFVTQKIHLNDNIPPTANSLPDLGPYECYDAIPPPDVNIVTGETDNCGRDVLVAYEGDSGDPGCSGVVMRYYSLTDICGNSVTISQNIVINDNEAPTADPLPDLGPYQSVDDIPDPDIKNITGLSDNCGNVTVEYVGDSQHPGCTGTITRFYSISDDCGNSRNITQDILINDTQAPDLSCPGDIEVINKNQVPLPFTSYLDFKNAGGNCTDNTAIDGSSFRFVSETSDNGITPEIITRIYTISDICGNSTTCSQLITVSNRSDVSLTIDDIAVQCTDDTPEAFSNLREFLDSGGSTSSSCGIDTLTFELVSESTNHDYCPELLTRIYKITDSCGISATCTQQITVNDTEPPEISCPEDFTVVGESALPDAYSNVIEFTAAGGSITDNCTLLQPTFALANEVFIDESTVERNYEIEDICGNTGQCTQTIHIIEYSMDCPPDISVECAESIPESYTSLEAYISAGGQASSSCGINATTFAWISDVSDASQCPEIITRTYSVADSCGNTMDCSQIITVIDTTAPTLTCPADIEIGKGGQLPAAYADLDAFISANGNASDNCGLNTASFTLISESSDGNYFPETVTRIYQISDICGNTAESVQIITVMYSAEPEISCPPEMSLLCGTEIPEAFSNYSDFISAGGSASGICGIDEDSFRLVSESKNGGCPDTITRIYEIVDSCDNAVQCEHKIYLSPEEDDTPPRLIAFEIMPTQVDVSENSQNLLFSYLVTDDISGLEKVQIKLQSPSEIYEINIKKFTLVIGDSLIGNYKSEVTMPQNAEMGLWLIERVELTDEQENKKIYYSNDLAALGFTNGVEVLNCQVEPVTEYISICAGENYHGLSETGTYVRTLKNEAGCDSVVTTHLTVHNLPAKPEIMVDADTLSIPAIYSTYQWYLEGQEINSANSSGYIISQSGTYYVNVTNAFGCDVTSESRNVFYSAVPSIEGENFSLTLYPNPNNGEFYLKVQTNQKTDLRYTILDNTGRTLFANEIKNITDYYVEEVKPGKLTNGIYILLISANQNSYVKKFVVR